MEAILSAPLILSDEERDMLLDLLARERSNLPVEIRHTRTGKFREVLKHRLKVVNELTTRLGGQEEFYGH